MRTAIKYQIWSSKKSITIFYSIIYTIYIALLILMSTGLYNAENNSIGGIEFASVIFIFVAGLNSFKESFKMFLQNSLSRKQLFISFATGMISTAAFMALIDNINTVIMTSISDYEPAFFQFYGQQYPLNSASSILSSFIWCFSVYAMMGMIGYMIAVAYYRMSKVFKVAVSVGVPVFFFTILPIIDTYITKGIIFRLIFKYFQFIWGTNSYNTVIASILSVVILGTISWLLIRKAIIKD